MKILYVISNCRIGGAEMHLLRIVKTMKRLHPSWIIDCLITHERGKLWEQYNKTFDNVSHHPLKKSKEIAYGKKTYDLIHGINNFEAMKTMMELHPEEQYCSMVWMDMRHKINNTVLEILKDSSKNYCAFFSEFKAGLDPLPSPGKSPHLKVQVNNGIDTKFWAPPKNKNKARINSDNVCWVGSMVERKQPLLLAELIKKMPVIHFFVIANEGRSDGAFSAFAVFKELEKNQKNLSLHWNVEPKDLRKFYRKSKAFLLTSKSEGQPGVLLEAMACDCIPVAGDVSGIPDILSSDPPCGHLVPQYEDKEKQMDAYEEAIQEAVFNRTGRMNPRGRILENFSIAKSVKKYIKIYREILG